MARRGFLSYAWGQISPKIVIERVDEDKFKATTTVNNEEFSKIADSEAGAARELKTFIRDKAMARDL